MPHSPKRSLSVLHLSSEKSWRGGEQQIAYLIEELNQKDVKNVVACQKGSAFEVFCQQKQWAYYNLSFKGSFDLSTSLGINKICKQEKIDLIHIHSAKSHGLAVLSHVLGNSTPLILSRRVDFPVRDNFLTQWKYNHPAIKKIICVSHAIEKIVRSNIKYPDKCLTIHSGIDIARFKHSKGYLRKTFQIPNDYILVGNTSALAGHKDYPTFIRTAEILRQQNIKAHFFMIGDGPDKEILQNMISEKNLGDHISMTGFMNNIPEILPELDIFLMPSETEGLGTSILDAFACKVAVVATRAGGIPEMVIHEKTGLLAEIKDVQSLAAHIYQLITEPSLREKLVESAYLHLLKNFTKESMSARTLEIYHDILKHH
ncbi:glycosyltransferase family 4 protein [Catalinimonas niigatensis]|uniref:glycosyltransferase family 4 protein n=1 Tax=Catalinimonas niigatensis TaxID=1397264 RepID=UPI002667127B|nr:glycosyltransferase family 4 protein [Catalinimonas niigatensis]WPP52546.1 glycosyltransferase family 4 protein [Catalinimonas niigatensis]